MAKVKVASLNSLNPPKSKKELFERLRVILTHGWYEMPTDVARYNGSGGPGNYIEDLLGLNCGNQDIPDSAGWEIKYYTDQTNLITLFHKEPQPEGIMRHMVSRHGWADEQGRKSFRHTIQGRSDRFEIDIQDNRVTVRPRKGNGPVPHWSHDVLLNIAGGKLRRLILVKGEKDGRKVRYTVADCFQDMQISFFIYELAQGTIAVDFDARESSPGSNGLRNHGTKFRVAPSNVCRLYCKKERFS